MSAPVVGLGVVAFFIAVAPVLALTIGMLIDVHEVDGE